MNIYFVNKDSTLKGPFDITNSQRQRIIKIGDVILRETANGLAFNIVVANENKWSSCKCVECTDRNLNLEGNTLLFGFDGINKRMGNIKTIRKLKILFPTPPLLTFFENAISILSYQSDFWNLDIFYDIHKMTSIDLKQQNKLPPHIETNNDKDTNEYLFEMYMDEESELLFKSLLKQKTPLRSIYSEIRKLYPERFRKALKAFLKKHPNSTIYDK